MTSSMRNRRLAKSLPRQSWNVPHAAMAMKSMPSTTMLWNETNVSHSGGMSFSENSLIPFTCALTSPNAIQLNMP